jgi:hypothetical protein
MTRHDAKVCLRHMLDHILWAIVQQDLPPLVAEVESILSPDTLGA